MACCVVAAYVVRVLGRLLPSARRGPAEEPFAPVAVHPGPVRAA
jgi:hypothetical protein